MIGMLRSIWLYRGFIIASVKREFQLRYMSSVLGGLWLVLQPIAMILVYTLVLSQVMRARMAGTAVTSGFSYSVFICSGVLAWNMFSEIISRTQTIFLDQANLIKKQSIPKICLPVIPVLLGTVNFLMVFSLFLVFIIAIGAFPGYHLLAIPVLIIIQLALAIGIGVTVAVLNVFFRDVGQAMSIILQFWFWFTPIVYPLSALPEWAHSLLKWNPMVGVIGGYQAVFSMGKWPDWGSLIYPAVLGVGFLVIALLLYRQHSAEIVDEL